MRDFVLVIGGIALWAYVVSHHNAVAVTVGIAVTALLVYEGVRPHLNRHR